MLSEDKYNVPQKVRTKGRADQESYPRCHGVAKRTAHWGQWRTLHVAPGQFSQSKCESELHRAFPTIHLGRGQNASFEGFDQIRPGHVDLEKLPGCF